MAKILIDFKEASIPNNNDLIAYNNKYKRWEEISISNFLSQNNLKIKKINCDINALSNKIDELEEYITTLEEKIKYLAKIEKENI